MLLFRLVDLPRRVHRLIPALPLDPSANSEAHAASAVVGWTLEPALLDAENPRMRRRVARILALYAEAEGQPRSALNDLSMRVEELMGNYRLARCLARSIEYLGYQFVPPPRGLSHEPAALRALCYRRAQERHNGYVPRAERAAFVAAIAADLDSTPEDLEAALWADRTGAALLQRRPETDDGGALTPARVIACYNATAVATVIAASSWVTIELAATDTAALKSLYRHARALHVGVEITQNAANDTLTLALYGPGSRALVRGRTALVDGSASVEADAHNGDGPEPGENHDDAPEDADAVAEDAIGDDSLEGECPGIKDAGDRLEAGGPRETATGDGRDARAGRVNEGRLEAGGPSGTTGDRLEAGGPSGTTGDRLEAGGPRETSGDVRVPAAGGAPVAAVVTRLARRHPSAILRGWTRLLGTDRRLYHVALEEPLLAALREERDEVESAASGDALYDSAVEESFARAFHAHECAGRLGLVRGWTLHREPRTVVVGTTVFLPDFAFRRGDIEVYGEVIGYYTEEYLTRKVRKLAALRGQLPLLLIADQSLAPAFAAAGFPMVTYKAGRQIAVPDVVAALERDFDPFTRRRARARTIMARLCAVNGPNVPEENLAAAIGCAGRSELLTVWAEIRDGAAMRDLPRDEVAERLRAVAEARAPYLMSAVVDRTDDASGKSETLNQTSDATDRIDDAADRFPRRYLAGYGLVQGGALAAARVALHELLQGADSSIPLPEALACVRGAGIPDADDALLERLGAVVARADLFGEARVHLPGAVADSAGVATGSAAPASSRRRRRKDDSTRST